MIAENDFPDYHQIGFETLFWQSEIPLKSDDNVSENSQVFGFDPVEIAVTAERVDVMLRDDTGALYHLEEQRNLRKSDLFRFASYHFLAARQWGEQMTDILLASGEVYAGEKVISTQSGKYAPIVVDFTQRDGHTRLAEIREAVQAGTFETWLELVFLPLYGQGQESHTVQW